MTNVTQTRFATKIYNNVDDQYFDPETPFKNSCLRSPDYLSITI